MRVQPWNLIFLVGFIAYVGIRGVFERRTSGIDKTVNRTDTRERILLPFVGLGSLLLRRLLPGRQLCPLSGAVGSVTAVDVKTMKATGHYSFVDKGGCNGLALDVKNQVLFAACGLSGNPPAQPMMVILSATDGKILANLPLAGGPSSLPTAGTAPSTRRTAAPWSPRRINSPAPKPTILAVLRDSAITNGSREFVTENNCLPTRFANYDPKVMVAESG